MRKKRKFPQDVARFFNPQKSGTNAEYDQYGRLLRLGTNQEKRRKEKSCIPVYGVGGTAIKKMSANGEVKYT